MYPDGGRELARTGMRNKLFILHGLINPFYPLLMQYSTPSLIRTEVFRFKNSVPITEFVRISEVTLILWRINDIKICDNPILLVLLFNPILNALNL